MGPNVKRLAIHKMSLDAVPPGGGAKDAVAFLSDPKRLTDSAREAQAWAEAAVRAVREASDPNPWRTADDEAIAAEILRQIESRKQEQRRSRR